MKQLRNASRLNFKRKLKNCFSSHGCLLWAVVTIGNPKNCKKHIRNIQGWFDKILRNIQAEGRLCVLFKKCVI